MYIYIYIETSENNPKVQVMLGGQRSVSRPGHRRGKLHRAVLPAGLAAFVRHLVLWKAPGVWKKHMGLSENRVYSQL